VAGLAIDNDRTVIAAVVIIAMACRLRFSRCNARAGSLADGLFLFTSRDCMPMIRSLLICALLALTTTAAMAGSFAGTSAGGSSAGSSASSGSSSGDDKVVLQARDDAASFVASEGHLRGARLEAAMRQLRERNPDARQATDMQLAQAILAL
jgi:uncharacterized protein (TIGR02448 family)